MAEQKFWFRMYNPERLEDMRVFIGTVDEITAQIEQEIPWPQSELWIQGLKEKAREHEPTL